MTTQQNTSAETHSDQGGEGLPTAPEKLLLMLDELGIEYKFYEHDAVYTVAESEKLDADIPGLHCRNLYLRDKKKRNYLISAQNATEIDLKKLSGVLGAGRFSFGSADRLWQYLGVRPGSVCPYAVVNDPDNEVMLILDQSMMDADLVNFHPLSNTMTIGTNPHDIVKFAQAIGHNVEIVHLSAAAPDHTENNIK